MKKNIALIGMAGCGKTVVGRILARLIGFKSFDLDEDLERKLGKSVERLLEDFGDGDFLQTEGMALAIFLGGNPAPENYVISLSGSVVLLRPIMTRLQEHAVVVFLDTPFDVLEKRMTEGRTRGAIVGLSSKSLRQIYDERLSLYRAYADVTVFTNDLTEEEVARRIVQFQPRGICADA